MPTATGPSDDMLDALHQTAIMANEFGNMVKDGKLPSPETRMKLLAVVGDFLDAASEFEKNGDK